MWYKLWIMNLWGGFHSIGVKYSNNIQDHVKGKNINFGFINKMVYSTAGMVNSNIWECFNLIYFRPLSATLRDYSRLWSEITPQEGKAQKTIRGCRDGTLVGHVQGKHRTHYCYPTILWPLEYFYNVLYTCFFKTNSHSLWI